MFAACRCGLCIRVSGRGNKRLDRVKTPRGQEFYPKKWRRNPCSHLRARPRFRFKFTGGQMLGATRRKVVSHERRIGQAPARGRTGGCGISLRVACQTVVRLPNVRTKAIDSDACLQYCLQENVYFGDRLGDSRSLTRQGSQAETIAYLQISRYFLFWRHGNVPHSAGLRLIGPTPIRLLVFLLVFMEHTRPNGSCSRAI